jgi:hypothetical protein
MHGFRSIENGDLTEGIKRKDEFLMKKILVLGFGFAVVIIVSFIAGAQYYLHIRTTQEISRRVDEITYVESLEYENLKVGLWKNQLILSNVSLKLRDVKELFRAGEIRISNLKTYNGHILGFNVEINDLGIPLKSFLADETFQYMKMVNPDKLLSTIGCNYHYDPDQRGLELNNIKILSPDLAEVEASIRLVNIDPSTIALNNPVGLIPQLFGISISQASVIYIDHSFLGKFFGAQSNPTDSNMPAAIAVFSENVNQMIQIEKDEKTRTVLKNFQRFLTNPEKLHVTLSPENPVPLVRFLWVRHFNEVVELLNMKVET